MIRPTPLLILLVVLPGCGSQPSGGGGGTQTKLPIQTSIPEGIYLGDITWRNVGKINGVVDSDTSKTEAYSEIVDEHGLPLIQPDGEIPVEGLVLTTTDVIGTSTLRITSVNASGNRLIINFTTRATIEGIRFSGVGSWTYEYIPPDTLTLIDLRAVSSEIVNLSFASFESTGTARLTK